MTKGRGRSPARFGLFYRGLASFYCSLAPRLKEPAGRSQRPACCRGFFDIRPRFSARSQRRAREAQPTEQPSAGRGYGLRGLRPQLITYYFSLFTCFTCFTCSGKAGRAAASGGGGPQLADGSCRLSAGCARKQIKPRLIAGQRSCAARSRPRAKGCSCFSRLFASYGLPQSTISFAKPRPQAGRAAATRRGLNTLSFSIFNFPFLISRQSGADAVYRERISATTPRPGFSIPARQVST